MNGKKAKMLRNLSGGNTAQYYDVHGTIVLHPYCSRAVYKSLKRFYKDGRHVWE
jgi:hypothetical protein